MPSDPRTTAAPPPPKENVKETIISVIIAFAMAFVFRSFVAEAFIIPTGSMGPTLNGAHMRFTSPATGRDWAVAPWYFYDGARQNAVSNQGDAARNNLQSPVIVHDPLVATPVTENDTKARAGDRIFVLKYLYGIQSPAPFDVVVFKNPTNPDENYIKRLVGLPGEQIAIIDGDVFVRKAPAVNEPNPWAGDGWTIRRKQANTQRAVWQEVFDSSVMSQTTLAAGVRSPWGVSGSVKADGVQAQYTLDASGGELWWDRTVPFMPAPAYRSAVEYSRTREINDRYAYNETFDSNNTAALFPVGDIRVRARVLASTGSTLTLSIDARGQRFSATLADGKAALWMQPVEMEGQAARTTGEGTVLQEEAATLPTGVWAGVEFWHADQRLQLWINGKLVASADYHWSPTQRLAASLTTLGLERFNGTLADPRTNWADPRNHILSDPAAYRSSGARITTNGGQVRLAAVGLDRDLYYRATNFHPRKELDALSSRPATATHPTSTITLAPTHYFVCGDNSPQSLDGRLWGNPSPWVAAEFDPAHSVVEERLMMGKAFFVYFPAPVGGSPVGVPDFGRLRFIR